MFYYYYIILRVTTYRHVCEKTHIALFADDVGIITESTKAEK